MSSERLDSQSAQEYKSDRSREELSNEYLLAKVASIQLKTSPLKTTRSPKLTYAYARIFSTRIRVEKDCVAEAKPRHFLSWYDEEET